MFMKAERGGERREGLFFLQYNSRGKCIDIYMTEWFRGMFYSALMGIINVWRKRVGGGMMEQSQCNLPESPSLPPSATFSTTGWNKTCIRDTEGAGKYIVIYFMVICCYLHTVQTLWSSYSSSHCLPRCPHHSYTCLYHYLGQEE